MIVGKRIVNVRTMTKKELRAYDWDYDNGEINIVIVLDDGTEIYSLMDEEGNGPGTMIERSPHGEDHYLKPE